VKDASTDINELMRCIDGTNRIYIRLLGGLEVYRGGVLLEEHALYNSKLRPLICHLALAAGRGIPRERLVRCFWPERDEGAMDSFYVLWSKLGRLLSGGRNKGSYLLRSGTTCRLNDSLVLVDVQHFEAKAKELLFGCLEPKERILIAQELEMGYRGGLQLEQCDDSMLMGHRERIKALFVDVMLEGSRLLEESGNHISSLWMARKAFEADPTKEEVYQALMAAQIKAGQRTSAMQTYMACKRFLSEELGLLPSQSTTTMYQQILLDKRQ